MITAATVAMSAALAGFAFAASPSGPTTTDDTSVVAPASTAGPTSTTHRPGADDRRDDNGHGSDDLDDGPDDSDGRVGGGHGSDGDGDDDGPDDSDDRSGSGHGSDD